MGIFRVSSGIVLVSALLAPAAACGQVGTRQPYLQRVGPHEVTIVWDTEEVSEGLLRWGSGWDRLHEEVSTPPGTHHEVRITDLHPGGTWFYSIEVDGEPFAGPGEAWRWTNAPQPGGPERVRFWVVGDSGTGGLRQAEVRDAMLGWVGEDTPDLYLHVGDMAYGDGTEWEFSNNFYAPYADILRNTPVFPAIGNHEGRSSSSGSQSGPYYEGYVLPTAGELGGLASGTEAYYSFDWGPVHFISLDSYDSPRGADGAMAQWLEADLAATEQPWVVAYWHHPPYTKGSHDSDIELRHIQMRNSILPILEAGGVDLVLGGHSHIYERSYLVHGGYETPTTDQAIVDAGDGRPDGDGGYVKPQGVAEGALFVVAGHGGTGVGGPGNHPLMAFSEVANGSVIVDVEGGRMTLHNIRWDGVETDRVELIKEQPGLLLLGPSGGRLWPESEAAVRWAGSPGVGEVALAWRCADHEDWRQLASDLPASGSWEWAVPGIEAEGVKLRVSAGGLVDTGDVLAITTRVAEEVVPWGSRWRYRADGSDPGSDWYQPDTDDSDWPSGAAELGYGDGDEATELPDPDPNHPSHYFRHSFEVDVEVLEAELSVRYDDGAAVWLDGALLWQADMAEGLAHDAWASGEADDNQLATFAIPAASLTPGPHTLAVMVKQVSGSSSDLSFDLSLAVTALTEPLPGCESLAAGDDDDDGGDDDDDDSADPVDPGCGCSQTQRPAPVPTGWRWLWAALGGVAWSHRRRRRTR